jgi:hypothetical protein
LIYCQRANPKQCLGLQIGFVLALFFTAPEPSNFSYLLVKKELKPIRAIAELALFFKIRVNYVIYFLPIATKTQKHKESRKIRY